MKISDLIEQLEKISPKSTALEWDNVGLLAGDLDAAVKRVFITLDVTAASIRQAKENRCDLILSHHPLMMSGIKSVTANRMPGALVWQMVSEKIGHIAMHTNFDTCIMTDLVAKRLKIEKYSILDITDSDDDTKRGIGFIYDLKETTSVKQLAKTVKEAFDIPVIGIFGDEMRNITRVAVVPGSGRSEIPLARAAGAHVLITGDITHHVGLDAYEEGLSIIDAGHYGLEHIFVGFMKSYIDENIPGIETVAEKAVFPRSYV